MANELLNNEQLLEHVSDLPYGNAPICHALESDKAAFEYFKAIGLTAVYDNPEFDITIIPSLIFGTSVMNDKIYCINCSHCLGTPANVRFDSCKDDSSNDGNFQMLIKCPVCGSATHVTVHRVFITCKPWGGEFD